MAPPGPLTGVQAALDRAGRDLGALGRRWALVGGLAVSVRAEPRFTRDADLAVAVADDRDGEALVRDLQDRGYGVLSAIEQEATRRLAAVRLSLPGESPSGVVLDLLFASSGIELEIVGGAEVLEVLPGLRIPVATVGHLLVLKVLSRDDRTRPQDAADLLALRARAGPDDAAVARRLAGLVVTRGFHRGRDVRGDLECVLAGAARP